MIILSTHNNDAIVGQAPNLAARIQSLAELNTVYISSSTYKLLGVDFECKDLGFHELKGIPEPIQVYQALHEHTGASRLEVFSSNLTPFTGREKEMEILKDRWHLSAAGKGQVVVVNGEAGIGKSRIVHAMKEFNAAQKDSWLTEIRCSQFYSNSSFYPVIDMIERVVLNITKEDTPEDRLLKLEGWSAQYGTNESLVPLMASLLSIPLSDKYSPLNLTPVKQKEKTINTLVSFMLKRAKVQPVLFIAEDLHWADPSTLELLNKFIERSAGTRIFSVFTHRPAFTHSWDKHKHVERINLDRLSEKESKKVVFNVTGHKRIPEDAIDYILKKTDGIPLFLEELTGMMIEEEMFTEAGGRYELSQPINMLAVPNTLNDLLAARLDRMKEAKPVAQLASAIGREFSLSMLENIPGEHQINLQEKLQKLLDAGLLYEKKNSLEKEYVFKHALIQDSAYASLLRNSKRTYHNAIANSLIKHRPDIVEAKPELIANHFSKADDASTAMTFWQKAGQLAIQKSAMPEAISHLTKAVEESNKMPQSPERLGGELMAQTYLGLANMQAWGYGHPDVERAFSRARGLCKIMGDPPQIFPVLHGLVKFRLVRGEYETGLKLARQLQATAEETKDENLLIEALYVVGAAQCWMGQPEQSKKNLDRLIDIYDYQKHASHAQIYGEDPCVTAHSHNLWQRAICGEFSQSINDLEQAEDLVVKLNHPWTTDYLNTCRTQMYTAILDLDKTEESAQAFLESAIKHGFPWWVACAQVNVGWTMAQRGKIKQGLNMAEENLNGWRMMGAEMAIPWMYLRIAEIYLLEDKVERCIEALNEALIVIVNTKEGLYEADIHRLKGVAMSRLGSHPGAFKEINRAISLASKRKQLLWLIRALNSHVELSYELKNEQRMLTTLEETINKIEHKKDQVDILKAKELLSSLKS